MYLHISWWWEAGGTIPFSPPPKFLTTSKLGQNSGTILVRSWQKFCKRKTQLFCSQGSNESLECSPPPPKKKYHNYAYYSLLWSKSEIFYCKTLWSCLNLCLHCNMYLKCMGMCVCVCVFVSVTVVCIKLLYKPLFSRTVIFAFLDFCGNSRVVNFAIFLMLSLL